MIEAGFGRALNAFPDLYIAFYRWALWRLFEADGAVGRGVLAFITNRGFLTGSGFGGLRSMLRKRFDNIRIIDLRGDNRGSRPATVPFDENVFNIEVGVCILVAYATGEKEEGEEAEVVYADAWRERAFSRREKLDLALAAAADESRLQNIIVHGSGMAPLKPAGFSETDWPSIEDIFTVRFNGIVTYRDSFAYHTDRNALAARLRNWLTLPLPLAATQFGESSMNKVGPALRVAFDENAIQPVSYRPLDIRFLYHRSEYVDRLRPDLQAAWGAENIALFSMRGIGQGPAVWCHGLKPDQHSFRESYGGWAFPLRNHAPESLGHFLNPLIVPGLSAVYGNELNPQDLFDAVLGLLSATSYTTRFAHDLEDDFPHVPLPADPALFERIARLGRRIRELETFADAPAQGYRVARLSGRGAGRILDMPTPQRAYVAEAGTGEIALLADRSFRISNVSERIWQFSVSGYPVLYRWLRARNGEPISAALQRSMVDIVARIGELLQSFDEADQFLVESLQAPLTRVQMGLPPRDRALQDLVDEDDGAA